jgi:formate dehydrogenase major subunit
VPEELDTNYPKYEVTAVQVTRSNQPSDWQDNHKRMGETNQLVQAAE